MGLGICTDSLGIFVSPIPEHPLVNVIFRPVGTLSLSSAREPCNMIRVHEYASASLIPFRHA